MPKRDGEFTLTSWDEETYAEREGERKLTRAKVTQDLSGGVTGKGQVEWLMSYGDDGTAHFVGLQQFEGVIDGELATWDCKVVQCSGTGGWSGMTGEGHFSDPHGPKASFKLDYSFD